MFEYLFGRYLMNTARLTNEKLLEIIDWGKAEQTLGAVSVTMEATEEIERLSSVIDEKLLELTATYEPVAGLSRKGDEREKKPYQPNFQFFKGLNRKEIIPSGSLRAELLAFEKHYSLDKAGVSKAFDEDTEAVLASFIDSRDYFANQYMTVLMKYILRFVSEKTDFSPSSGVFSYSSERMVIQKTVTADTRYFIGIGGEKITLQRLNDLLSGSFASGGHNQLGHGRYDSLITFINCVSCIFQSLIEKEKEILLIDCPSIYKFSTVSANEYCFTLPVSSDDLKLDLLVGFGYRPNFATICHNI